MSHVVSVRVQISCMSDSRQNHLVAGPDDLCGMHSKCNSMRRIAAGLSTPVKTFHCEQPDSD